LGLLERIAYNRTADRTFYRPRYAASQRNAVGHRMSFGYSDSADRAGLTGRPALPASSSNGSFILAVFVRPATWNYDQELFRSALTDEDRMEALLAAIAIEGEDLWVVESDERPVAFAHVYTGRGIARVECLFVAPSRSPLDLVRPLLERIEEPTGHGKAPRLEIPTEAVRGADDQVLQAAGLCRRGTAWIRPAAGSA